MADVYLLCFTLVRSLIGDLDVEADKAQDRSAIRAEQIPETRHY